MKAVILVGGEGTRMRPLTETTPKPLLPFMNRPFLAHVLDHLAAHGVEEAVCSSPYLEEVFRALLASRQGVAPAVRWITEAEPLGTAGAVAGAREHLDDTFFVLNGDILTDLDLGDLLSHHRNRAAAATIALTEVADARPFGLVDRDADGRVRRFLEKPSEPVPGAVNAGTYVLEPGVLDAIPPGRMVSIERETYPLLIAGGHPVYGFVGRGYWRDLGTPAAYLEGHLDALEGIVDLFRGLSAPLLSRSAAVDPGSSIGRHVVVGDAASIAAGATVERAVLHEGARIEEGAVVEGSILGRGVVVGARAMVRDSVLGDGAEVGSGAVAVDVKLGPGERLDPQAGLNGAEREPD
jgi:mannose-1-phosphate guanylyltransferase